MKYSKRLKQIIIIIIVGFSIILFIKCLAIHRYRPLASSSLPIPLIGDYYDYGGIFHCHSIHSDGSGSIEEIMEAANEVGLKYLILTDHNTRQTLKEGREGWYGDCFLLIGEEISTFAGHYVGLDIPPAAFKFSPQAQPTIDDVTELGGFGIIAHPFTRSKAYWRDWSVEGFQGMELINIDSQWRDEAFYELLLIALIYKLNPIYTLLRTFDYPTQNMTKWDQLMEEIPMIGIAATDAHQNVHLLAGLRLKLPSYQDIFSLAQVHILTPQPLIKQKEDDKENIYGAIRKGNFYICLEGLAKSGGFLFQAQCQGQKVIMGDTLALQDYADLFVAHSFPVAAEILLIKDGKQITKSSGKKFSYKAHKPGVYRVEVWPKEGHLGRGKRFPWIISNPIYIRDKDSLERKTEQRLSHKLTSVSPDCQLLLEDFEQFPLKSLFKFEHDASSFINKNKIIDHNTPMESSSKALVMTFRLGETNQQKKEVWCALGERKRRDLSGYQGISFYAKGDKPYRVGFQLREEDIGGGEEKIEQWAISVKIRPQWEKKTIFFKDMYLVSKNTNSKRELNKVKGIFFILDQRNTHPGTKGTLWLDEICLF